jgi:E3 ubiquitin-protein ligase RNF38/44
LQTHPHHHQTQQASPPPPQLFTLLGLGRAPQGSFVLPLLRVAVPVAASCAVLYMALAAGGGQGRWQHLRRALLRGFGGGTGAGAQQQGQQQHRQRRPGQPQPQRATLDMVASVLQKLPTEHYASAEELHALPGAELRRRLAKRRLLPSSRGLVERRELCQLLASAGGGSGSSCSICFEDYAAGEVLRVLPCSHRFHLECVDKWLLFAATDHVRLPACPLCNAELLQPGAGSAGA